MQFLIKNNGGKAKAHLWNGKDTLCTMFSTGGIKRSVHISDTNEGKEICQMCATASKSKSQSILLKTRTGFPQVIDLRY